MQDGQTATLFSQNPDWQSQLFARFYLLLEAIVEQVEQFVEFEVQSKHLRWHTEHVAPEM